MSAAAPGPGRALMPGVRALAHTSARGYERISWPVSCWRRSSSPRAWPTRSWLDCRRSPGLYTTIACLVGYAVFGPSRVLVLGPDSSISPLILAAITPLLAGGGPATAIALAGMLAVLVGLTEIGLGLGKLGFVADLLSKEVQVGYMNGLGITIIVGQLPKLFGFSTPRRLVPRRGPRVRRRPRPDRRRRR